MRGLVGLLLGLWIVGAGPALGATLQVGPGKTYAKPCQALAAAHDDDVIEIDAAGNGTYDGDVCAFSQNGLTLRGVNGRAHVDAASQNAQGKAIWVISGNDTTVENVELSGCHVVDQNGAGIRQQGKNLTVRGSYFHDNEDGILESNVAGSEILIETSEFKDNGAGDGYSHNMYIGHATKFTLRYCYSHHAKVGHDVKSRAGENHILYNRIGDESDGTASYEIDLPNGGTSYVIGNVIQQGPATQNPTILTYLEEGANPGNPGSDLYVVNNTFVDQRATPGLAVRVNSSTPAVIKNNIFYGGSTLTDQASAVLANNYGGADPRFADLASFDLHLLAGSPCIDAAADPGSANGLSLAPLFQYVHPASFEARPVVGALDIGAFEFGQGVLVDAGAPGADAQVVVPGVDGSANTISEDASTPDGAALAHDAGALGQVAPGCGCSASGSGLLALGMLALATSRGGRRALSGSRRWRCAPTRSPGSPS